MQTVRKTVLFVGPGEWIICVDVTWMETVPMGRSVLLMSGGRDKLELVVADVWMDAGRTETARAGISSVRVVWEAVHIVRGSNVNMVVLLTQTALDTMQCVTLHSHIQLVTTVTLTAASQVVSMITTVRLHTQCVGLVVPTVVDAVQTINVLDMTSSVTCRVMRTVFGVTNLIWSVR